MSGAAVSEAIVWTKTVTVIGNSGTITIITMIIDKFIFDVV
jgi:hypothetical protein